MRVAQLFTRGLTLLHPDQPMVAGQPVEFLLEADSHNIRDVNAMLVAPSTPYFEVYPTTATFHDPVWSFTPNAYTYPSSLNILAVTWRPSPASFTCEGIVQECSLDALIEARVALPSVP